MVLIWHIWIIFSKFFLTLSFTHELRNITVIYKPNSFIYHLCQTTNSINSKRIHWHYESLYNSSNLTDFYCKDFYSNSNCFDFYYDSSISLLVIKEPDIFMGRYTCYVYINSTYEIQSTGWIDVKLPFDDANQSSSEIFNEYDLGELARYYHVPFIFDENDLNGFGKRVELGGIFQTKCQSIESSYPIDFLWIHLRNSSEGIKTIHIVQHDENRILIKDEQFSSTLFIYSVNQFDDGDYVCIASNILGRSFSSIRSLIVSERMILPRIHTNLLNHSYFDLQENPLEKLDCFADGYPIPEVTWTQMFNSIVLARNYSHAILNLINAVEGLDEFVCKAKNKHGSTKIFLKILKPNTQLQPILSSNHIQSRSVILQWHISGNYVHYFDYFIIYYRCLKTFHRNEWIDSNDYRQIVVYSRMINNQFTYRISDLIPFTKYEFLVKGFLEKIPTNSSNSIVLETLESLPEKISHLQGYIWNQTSIVIHWSPPNSTNAPNFYYVLYYTTNTSIPFDQWSNIIIETYPFYILQLTITNDFQLYLRIASVNNKGYTLSDFYIINSNRTNFNSILKINRFQCSIDEDNRFISLQWLIHSSYDFNNINKYLLYYSDLTTTNNNNHIRILPITIDHLSRSNYTFNISLLDLNSNSYHILRLNLAIIDQYENQFPQISSSIFCFFSNKFGKHFY